MSEPKYNYWHPVYQPVKPDEMPLGCDLEYEFGKWVKSFCLMSAWETRPRRWPIDQTPPATEGKHFDDLTAIPNTVTFAELDDDTQARLRDIGRGACEFWNVVDGDWSVCKKVFGDNAFVSEDTYRQRPAPKMRAMTRKEVLAWASSSDAFGWVVRFNHTTAKPPQYYTYETTMTTFERAHVGTLSHDGTGGEWKAFEVEA